MPSFESLADIGSATQLLATALRENQSILIVGDFDADGATSSALAVTGLRQLGATRVDYLIPDRARHGYGLTPAIVAVALQMRPDLIITVDNGISSHAGVDAARSAGCRVLVTDHHLPGEQLPAADAIVNPNRTDCQFSCKALAGVGVMFYVLLALRAHLRSTGWFAQCKEPAMAGLLDLVALGTVADVVPLDDTNRILVAQGLKRIRAGQSRPGIQALAQVAGRDISRLVAADIGFGLAPRINAAGRMDNMAQGVECLLAPDWQQAQAAASRLDAINLERRQRQQQMQDEAFAAITAMQLTDGDMPTGLSVYQNDWHAGIVGLIAGGLRERYHRPAVAFAASGGSWLKGSARSIPGVHIRDVLANIACQQPQLIERFGGHAMAAGLTLRADQLSKFQTAFATEINRWVSADMLAGEMLTDGELAVDDFTLDTAQALRAGGPWGAGFPEPVFDGVFDVVEQRIVGQHHLKMRVRPAGGGPVLDAIAFRHEDPVTGLARMAYRLDINRYRDADRLQLIVELIEDGNQ